MCKKIVVFLVLFMGFVSFTTAQNTSKVRITVKGIDVARGGFLYVALYDQAEKFPKTGQSLQSRKVEVSQEQITCLFEVPIGIYAIVVHHDANDNNKMDKNFMGIPKEGYCFSNNVFGFMGPPDFEKASFEIAADMQLEAVELKY